MAEVFRLRLGSAPDFARLKSGRMFFRKRPVPPPMVPDPGQQVRLLGWSSSGQGEVRAISEPYTNARGEVVVRVTQEREYQDALREGRRAIGIPWPVKQMVVVLPSEPIDAPEDTERAQSALEEQLAEERRRREEAERRVEELERRLETPQAPERVDGETERVDAPADATEAQEGVERRPSWWRRFFGG